MERMEQDLRGADAMTAAAAMETPPISEAATNAELQSQLDEAHKAMWVLYKELDDKNAALDRSNQELDQFATIASHDLQEPLRKVTAFAALLREEDGAALSESGLDYLGRMENASERMLVLIGDLLRLARVTSRAQPFEATDLAKIAETVVSDLEAQIAREKWCRRCRTFADHRRGPRANASIAAESHLERPQVPPRGAPAGGAPERR